MNQAPELMDHGIRASFHPTGHGMAAGPAWILVTEACACEGGKFPAATKNGEVSGAPNESQEDGAIDAGTGWRVHLHGGGKRAEEPTMGAAFIWIFSATTCGN